MRTSANQEAPSQLRFVTHHVVVSSGSTSVGVDCSLGVLPGRVTQLRDGTEGGHA